MPKDIAKIVKEYRQNKNQSQGDLACQLNFTQATISRVESGKQLPRPRQGIRDKL